MNRAVTGVTGIAVLLVVLQSTGGFTVELLGPDVLLTVTGFALTLRLLTSWSTGPDAGRDRGPGAPRTTRHVLRSYYARLLSRWPLLVLTVGVVLVVGVTAVGCRADGIGPAAAALGLANWVPLLGPVAAFTCPAPGAVADVDPLGAMWLVAVLAQLCLVWPLVLAAGRAVTRWVPVNGARSDRERWDRERWDRDRDRAPVGGRGMTAGRVGQGSPVGGRVVVGGALTGLAVVGAVGVGAALSAWGAAPEELAYGTHVRLGEFVIGAAAAVLVTALGRRNGTAGPPTPRDGGAARWWPVGLAVVGTGLVVASAVVAGLAPNSWLPYGGPVVAALGTAVVLLAVTAAPDGALTRALGRGGPVELGRSGPALLVVHLPVFWLLQLALPEVRPFALVVVGGTGAWLIALLLDDGVVRRLVRGRARVAVWAAVVVLAAGVALGGATGTSAVETLGIARPVTTAGSPSSGGAPDGAPPGGDAGGAAGAVVVVGGRGAQVLAADLAGGVAPVVDTTVPGCGLLPAAAPPSTVRTTAAAQLPTAGAVPDCPGSAPVVSGAAAVVVDLSDDALPRPDDAFPAPCDAAFRPLYRDLLADATARWTDGDPTRPVLVAVVDEEDPASRCLRSLVAEAVARQPALIPLGDPADVGETLTTALTSAAADARRDALRAACAADGPVTVVTPGC